jgi:hypothetical protein
VSFLKTILFIFLVAVSVSELSQNNPVDLSTNETFDPK